MSTIRDGLLALLTQGPAYGLQLRNELDARLQRAQHTNVGQVYSTLERLQTAGLVTQSSHTTDGLPLYTLSSQGEASARAWVVTPQLDSASRWEGMVSQILLVKSLPGVSTAPLIRAYREYWQQALAAAQDLYAPDLASDLRSSSEEGLCIAALSWLDRAEAVDDSGTPVSRQRPQRGRPTTVSQ